jgi:Zn-dependent metalloprotease
MHLTGRSKLFRALLIVLLLVLQLLLDTVGSGVVNTPVQAASAAVVPAASTLAQTSPTDCTTGRGFGLTAADQGLLSQLQQAASGKATIACHSTLGKVRFVGTEPGSPLPRAASLTAATAPEQVARTFLTTYGPLFGLTNQSAELNVMQGQSTKEGRNFIRFQQVYQNIPVIGGEIIVQSDKNQQIVSAGGELLPGPKLSVTPKITPAEAQNKALAEIAKGYKLSVTALTTTKPELWIYDSRIMNGTTAHPGTLVWRMEVTATSGKAEPIREFVLIDAQAGFVTLHFNQIADAKDRWVCNNNNNPTNPEQDCTTPVRTEGQPATGNSDIDLAYDYAGATYDFYFNNFGRDSLDGAGLRLKSTVNFCYVSGSANCPYQNAFWNGTQMYYGQGFAVADDVVGHELTHGFTQFTSHLFYFYQSGAINESLSDVFGEFIDQTDGRDGCAGSDPSQRWLLGEDLPLGGPCNGQIRNMKNPPAFNDPDRTGSPNYISGAAGPGNNDNGGVHTNSGVNNKAAYLMVDGDTFNGQTITGLGIPKAAQIYYELETHLLTSASDYQDMYNYLQQACNNLVGTHSITGADCQQVKKVVDATEMNLTPTNAPIPTDAPVCAPGKIVNTLFFDNLENTASGNWTSSATSGTNAWFYPENPNPILDARYATSGVHNLWGYDQGNVADYNIRMTSSVTLPANAFLRFNHSYEFDFFVSTKYDGGIVEYSTNGGGTWNDLGPLFSENGYNATISSGFGNPLGGSQAFGGPSNGYYASRANLNSLAGQAVRFRFRIGTDSSADDYGWFIDDIRIYTCQNPPTTTTLTSSLNPSLVGQSVTFTATVSGSGGTPTGTVTFKDGATTLGSPALAGGVATFTTSALTAGTHPITASYSGDANFSASASPTFNQTVIGGCTVAVTNNASSGAGSFSAALATANAGGANCNIVDLTSPNITGPIALGSGVTVNAGVTILGPACGGTPVTLQGGTGDGLTLKGGNIVRGVWVKGFAGRQIVTQGPGNKLFCTKATKV